MGRGAIDDERFLEYVCTARVGNGNKLPILSHLKNDVIIDEKFQGQPSPVLIMTLKRIMPPC